MPHTFKEIHLFSQRKYDGLVEIFPWYNVWIKNLISLFKFSDQIWITPRAKYLVLNLLKPFLNKTRVIKV
ncbi:MAG: hypothetical protein ACE5J0_02765 [Candidatus Paceibacterales bacterium]